MSEESGEGRVASSFIWAVALIVIVGMIVAAVYYGGFLRGTDTKKIDIDVKVPSTSSNR